MLVRMITRQTGTLSLGDETVIEWPDRGGLIDLPEAVAAHEIAAGHAEEVTDEATADRPDETTVDRPSETPAGDASQDSGADADQAEPVKETAKERKARLAAEAAGAGKD